VHIGKPANFNFIVYGLTHGLPVSMWAL
jgi:hypothetical protein